MIGSFIPGFSINFGYESGGHDEGHRIKERKNQEKKDSLTLEIHERKRSFL